MQEPDAILVPIGHFFELEAAIAALMPEASST